ncbi:hypothetical protein KSP40_PGU013272 [Platanthera guangdongensis]|uniref:Leucine-rich repeat-containing N-terminal plant-type domain-containing protein n=1 Tax=Platanthera guangdongensis TaxID=2320717 RepID=A0ABR2N5R1_9ASPA
MIWTNQPPPFALSNFYKSDVAALSLTKYHFDQVNPSSPPLPSRHNSSAAHHANPKNRSNFSPQEQKSHANPPLFSNSGRSSSTAMAAVLLLLIPLLLPSASLSISDADTLLLLKSSFRNPDPALSSWISGQPNSSSPCGQNQWTGIICYHGIVVGLRLGHLGLSGTIDVQALAHLPALRTVSFVNNSLSGPLPDFGRIKALKSLYLSHNSFSGPIPDSLFTPLHHLKKLWLNDNGLSGKIPSSLSNATALLDLHIEDNSFSGAIPNLSLPSLLAFNASNNKLTGRIPASLVRFGAPAFQGNSGLCGSPVSGLACPAPAREKSSTPASTVDPGPGTAPVKKDGGGGKAVRPFVLFSVGLFLFLLIIVAFAVQNRRAVIDRNAVNDRQKSASAMDGMGTVVVVPGVMQSSPPSVSPGHKRAGRLVDPAAPQEEAAAPCL